MSEYIPEYKKGDVLQHAECVVTLYENVPEHFRYTVTAHCETHRAAHHLNITDLGSKWRRAQTVKLKTGKFTLTFESVAKLLMDNDFLSDGSEITGMHVDRDRDLLVLRVYNPNASNIPVPEGQEMLEIRLVEEK